MSKLKVQMMGFALLLSFAALHVMASEAQFANSAKDSPALFSLNR
jgi:hypothetical protein